MAWQGEKFRNQRGEFVIKSPRPIHFGLCEGSSDLIGWTPYLIKESDVGKTVAIFTAIEIKTAGTKTTEKQRNFIERVKMDGGFGEIVVEEKRNEGKEN